jgi:two-component system NtrC family response regulator
MRGAFTGAVTHKKGKMELADGGTLFLDEVAEVSPELQVKLLRAIQEGELEKIGSLEPVRIDVRFIAATNRDLKKRIEDGMFREDLYYRLAVVPIELPPLRERKEDIPGLFEHFFRRYSEERDRPGMRYDSSILPRLMHYNWPGNIRELQNVVERMIVLARGDTVGADDLPEPIHSVRPLVGNIWLELPDTGINLEEVERALLQRALEKCNWNQTRAAKFLDISRKTLIYRMEKFGLQGPAESEAVPESPSAASAEEPS